MKSPTLLSALLLSLSIVVSIEQSFAQNKINADDVVSKHLELSTNEKNWSDLESISEYGKMEYADKRIVNFSYLSKWPGKRRIELIEPISHRIVYENENEITTIKDGEKSTFNKGENLEGITVPSTSTYLPHNYSFALSKRGQNVFCFYKGDTTINNHSYFKIGFKEIGIEQTILFYIDKKTYLITYAQSVIREYDFLTHFEDYRWVNGYLLPFKSTYFKYGRLDYVKTTDKFSIENIDDSNFLAE